MAPNKTSTTKRGSLKSSKQTKGLGKLRTGGTDIKSRISERPKAPPPKQQKTKSAKGPVKKKRRLYTEKELGLPKLNMITPVGVEKPKGKKKGKVFIDDPKSMMTILAMVNADKEGQIESKMMKSRQMEEIREARKKEAEARQEQRKSKIEEKKDSIRRKRKRRIENGSDITSKEEPKAARSFKIKKKVSFG